NSKNAIARRTARRGEDHCPERKGCRFRQGPSHPFHCRSSGDFVISPELQHAAASRKAEGDMLDLSGKVAFVAGAGAVADGWGNGRATAVLLGRQGAKVFGTDYSEDALAGTTAAMERED